MFQESLCSSNTWKTLCFLSAPFIALWMGYPSVVHNWTAVFWSRFKPRLFFPEFFPHGELGLGSWLHLRLLMQPKSAGESSVLGNPWYKTPICFLFNRRILSAQVPKLSPCLLCCNPSATEKSLLQGGINPPLCPIQTKGCLCAAAFRFQRHFLVSSSAGCTKGQCTNRIQHWERTGL